MICPSLYLHRTTEKGWGVFTQEAIEVNVIIEISPVIVMSMNEKHLLDQTALYNYIFDWENGECCMGLGFISVYNHDYYSNCEYFQDYEEHTIIVKTVRNINAGEELTINYNGDWDNQKEVWFQVK